ncbi:AzlC family ABC transporter permease [Texcoconibacillus texcoconensis]|uniref:4-azaleucine resistance transporter AzlC n=1 Tax=Texcoconibacillus texcoconensis TaxID=1095777 RepID=A0A840QSS8_9BACI|nr:AzlC family ABC transporter permease [Texcoconibacillus texcoconensis]MBB5174327.1 4-azaleucine resistance transporter AzlC [Texcoconibacillus texcoconensis]
MEESISNKNDFREGLLSGIPIAIGYAPVAIAFGLLAKATGLLLSETIAMSMFVFAGAAQYMALSMISLGAGTVEIITATFIVNIRHLLMSASLNERVESDHPLIKACYAFGITDEVFAVASARTDTPIRSMYVLGVGLVAYGSWVINSGVGYVAGALIPETVEESMGMALYALFIALLIPAVRQKGRIVISLAILGGAFHWLFSLFTTSGWALLLGALSAIAVMELTEMSTKRGGTS